MDLSTQQLARYIDEILEETKNEDEKKGNQSDEGGEEEPEQIVQEPRSRGRPRIPLRWTRMISLYGDDLNRVRCFDLASDLLLDNAMDRAPVPRRGEV